MLTVEHRLCGPNGSPAQAGSTRGEVSLRGGEPAPGARRSAGLQGAGCFGRKYLGVRFLCGVACLHLGRAGAPGCRALGASGGRGPRAPPDGYPGGTGRSRGGARKGLRSHPWAKGWT